MKRALATLATLALLAAPRASAQAADPAKDPLKVGPTIYKLVAENERVRVMEVTFKPGDKIAMHCHPDHSVYIVKGGKLRVAAEKAQPQDMDVQPGGAVFMKAECHAAENVGTTDITVVVTELKEPAPPAAAPAAPKAR